MAWDASESFRRAIQSSVGESNLNSLNALQKTKGKLARLPSFEELASARSHPDFLYNKAVKLRVDRNEVEEKIIVPARRAVAALIQVASLINDGKSVIDLPLEMQAMSIEELTSAAIGDLIGYVTALEVNLLRYESEDYVDPDFLMGDTGLTGM